MLDGWRWMMDGWDMSSCHPTWCIISTPYIYIYTIIYTYSCGLSTYIYIHTKHLFLSCSFQMTYFQKQQVTGFFNDRLQVEMLRLALAKRPATGRSVWLPVANVKTNRPKKVKLVYERNIYMVIPYRRNRYRKYILIGSIYGIFSYIHHKNQLNVGKYTIHGSSGYILILVYIYLIFNIISLNCECPDGILVNRR